MSRGNEAVSRSSVKVMSDTHQTHVTGKSFITKIRCHTAANEAIVILYSAYRLVDLLDCVQGTSTRSIDACRQSAIAEAEVVLCARNKL